MSFVDFETVKKAVTFEQVMNLLGLQMKKQGNQWRGVCPTCKTGGPRSLVITEGKGFYCFADSKGGDQIALVSHVRQMPVKQAAQFIAEQVLVPSKKSTVSSAPAAETQQFQALTYLESQHAAVEAIGFDTSFAERLGIGFAPKGILRGLVAVPIRDEHGALLGYIGITEAKLPSSFTADQKKTA